MLAKLLGFTSHKLKQLDLTSVVLNNNSDLTATYETQINIGTPF